MTHATAPTTPSALPAGFAALLEVFADDLASVQFPGIDAAVLEAAAERVEAAAAEVRRREAELEAARAQLRATQDDALHKAQRAVAYARVFAQETPALAARLDAIALGRDAAPGAAAPALPAPRKRGRPPKSASVTPLFGAEPAPQIVDDDAGSGPIASEPARAESR
jgi:ElaB/YqjD/DUF883 family membrane-anchored ribosome-binding protein